MSLYSFGKNLFTNVRDYIVPGLAKGIPDTVDTVLGSGFGVNQAIADATGRPIINSQRQIAQAQQQSVQQAPGSNTPQTQGAVINQQGQVPQLTKDQILQDLANLNPELADKVMNILGYSNKPSTVDSFLKSGNVPSSALNTGATPTTIDLLMQQRQDLIEQQKADRQNFLTTFQSTEKEKVAQQNYLNTLSKLDEIQVGTKQRILNIEKTPGILQGMVDGLTGVAAREGALKAETLQRQADLYLKEIGFLKGEREIQQKGYEKILGFTQDDLKQVDDQVKAIQSAIEKMNDNARVTTLALLDRYGSQGLSQLSVQDQIYIGQQAEQAGIPADFIFSGIQTLNEEKNYQQQMKDAFSQQLQLENLGIAKQRLAITQQNSETLSKDTRMTSFLNDIVTHTSIPIDAAREDVEAYAISLGINPYTDEMQNILDKQGYKKTSGSGFFASIAKFLSGSPTK